MIGRTSRLALWVALGLRVAGGPTEAQPAVPPYQSVRHDEDYSYLKDPSRRSERLDRIKYMRLSDSRDEWFVSVGGEMRERFEYFRDVDWGADVDGCILQRYMLSADAHFGPRVRLFTHLKSGLEDGRHPGPRPTDEDRLDLHEAFADATLGRDLRATLRLGRQELSFGSQRLISIRSGPNVRQSFDGLSVAIRPGSWRLDVFAAKPVETDRGVLDDGPDHARTLWGLYAAGPLKVLREANADIYYLGLDRKTARFDQGTARELRESAGARIWRRAAPWDYNFELVYQWGRFGSAPIRAWTIASDTGFTLAEASWRPRFGLKADVTSGDKDPGDPTLQSFNPLFPRGAYFGESALIGPINHMDLHPSIDLRLTAGLTLSPSWVFFWRQSTCDGVYGVAGNLIRSGQATRARYVGSQAALTATARVNRHVSVGADGERFFAGPFLRESGPGRDVIFIAGWISLVF